MCILRFAITAMLTWYRETGYETTRRYLSFPVAADGSVDVTVWLGHGHRGFKQAIGEYSGYDCVCAWVYG